VISEVVQYKVLQAFKLHAPAPAVNYCFSLWQQYAFTFKIRNPRLSKAGDYTFIPAKKLHVITINSNLNPYNFLITFIHEVAHLVAFKKYGRRIMPHGKEWKLTFIVLMQPMLNDSILPDDILKVALKHFKNPKASTSGDPELVRILSRYNNLQSKNSVMLEDIPPGSIFTFRSKKYKKLEKRRTRIVCADSQTGRKFLISKAAIVEQEI
jgi:SprT protein